MLYVRSINGKRIKDAEARTEISALQTALQTMDADGYVGTPHIADGAITEVKVNSDFLKTIKNAYVTPEMFGAVGDGVTDDTEAFQAALNTNKAVIGNRSACYLIRKTLTYKIPSTSGAVNFGSIKDCNLIADNNFDGDNLIEIEIYEPNNRMIVSDCFFDCNGNVKNGLAILYCANMVIENVTVKNAIEKAFYCNNGYELFASNCYAKNEIETPNNVGFYISCTDSIFKNCISKNFYIGFYTDEGSVKFDGCHPWNNMDYYANNSIGVQTKGRPTFDNCEFDTCTIGVDIKEYYNVWFSNCYFLFNKNTVSSDVYYLKLETGTKVFLTNCYMQSITSNGNKLVTNRPKNIEAISTIISGTPDNMPKTKNSLANLDMLYNLVVAKSGDSLTVPANDYVRREFSIEGIAEGDLLCSSVMYDITGLNFKVTSGTNKITVTINNPTAQDITTSYCNIHVAVLRATNSHIENYVTVEHTQ